MSSSRSPQLMAVVEAVCEKFGDAESSRPFGLPVVPLVVEQAGRRFGDSGNAMGDRTRGWNDVQFRERHSRSRPARCRHENRIFIPQIGGDDRQLVRGLARVGERNDDHAPLFRRGRRRGAMKSMLFCARRAGAIAGIRGPRREAWPRPSLARSVELRIGQPLAGFDGDECNADRA